MTVQDLINRLNEYPKDAEVYIFDMSKPRWYEPYGTATLMSMIGLETLEIEQLTREEAENTVVITIDT